MFICTSFIGISNLIFRVTKQIQIQWEVSWAYAPLSDLKHLFGRQTLLCTHWFSITFNNPFPKTVVHEPFQSSDCNMYFMFFTFIYICRMSTVFKLSMMQIGISHRPEWYYLNKLDHTREVASDTACKLFSVVWWIFVKCRENFIKWYQNPLTFFESPLWQCIFW